MRNIQPALTVHIAQFAALLRDGSVGGHEAFILWDVISESQELSRSIATSVSHLAVHNPIPKWHGLISGVAFPYSPPEIDRGPGRQQ